MYPRIVVSLLSIQEPFVSWYILEEYFEEPKVTQFRFLLLTRMEVMYLADASRGPSLGVLRDVLDIVAAVAQ